MTAAPARRVERQFVLLGEAAPQVVSIALYIPIRNGAADQSLAIPMIEIDRRPS